MKGKRRRAPLPAPLDEAPSAFARGFLVTGLLVALQDRNQSGAARPPGRKVLRHALQGGGALAAGTVAAEALLRRNYGLAVAAVAVGAAGVVAAGYLLNDDNRENGLGQEKG